MIRVEAREGYRIWSAEYDRSPNPLLALEMRVVRERLGDLKGWRVVDVAAGTGRWMDCVAPDAAWVLGLDTSPEMLACAANRELPAGRLVVADMRAIPLAAGTADLAICSFGLSYVESPADAIREMARIARRLVVSDFHPAAAAAGWSRAFRSGDQVYEIRTFVHALAKVDEAARAAGLKLHWEDEAHFGLPEEALFQAAGKGAWFASAQKIPAIFTRCWGKR